MQAIPRSVRTEDMDLLRDFDRVTGPSYADRYLWETEEAQPRKVIVRGRSKIDPDVVLVRIKDEDNDRWVMACSSPFDGNVVGQDFYIRRRYSSELTVTKGMNPVELMAVARQRVAERFPQGYHKNAILTGEWDRGQLVQSELRQVTVEAGDA